jgi:hypothetical protein
MNLQKKKLKWYYHENSDCIFPDLDGIDFSHEEGFVHEIGDYKDGTIKEVRDLLRDSHLFLLDTPDLKKLIYNDIEQF